MLYRQERGTPKERGIRLLKDGHTCKGMAFTLYERWYFGIHGLLPPAFMTEDQQSYRVIINLRQSDDLARYMQLDCFQDRDEKLFYRVICDHVKELLPIVCTPTVGLACQKFGFIYRRPKGLYVTINDNSVSKIYHILSNWPETDVRVIVVTDGERVLGLGDLSCYGIGIPVGKLSLRRAGWRTTKKVLTDCVRRIDPFYIGLRRKRTRGEEYYHFVDNFMKACTKKFGQNLLIQFEDFARQNAYHLLERYRSQYCVFNDGIQGTASVTLAGLLACGKHTERLLSAKKISSLALDPLVSLLLPITLIQQLKLITFLRWQDVSAMKNLAALYPRPTNMENFMRSQTYQTTYIDMIDYTYNWPKDNMVQGYPVPYDHEYED
uniref:Malic domain-containing protein n=1 Tax=Elaeophora elaphi TaxID=1147741 RepID=A0A0R3S370_9BILA